jgi:hypothetical protein
VFWNHQNDEIRRWKQGEILKAVGEKAHAAGFQAWLVFVEDEAIAGQGCSPRTRIPMKPASPHKVQLVSLRAY